MDSEGACCAVFAWHVGLASREHVGVGSRIRCWGCVHVAGHLSVSWLCVIELGSSTGVGCMTKFEDFVFVCASCTEVARP